MNTTLQNNKPKDPEVLYKPMGNTEDIRLSVSIIQNQIAKPTRSGKRPEKADCIHFMMLCRAQRLNPFEGDAFLVGYDTRDGASWACITSHQNLLKRAENSTDYDGMESGLILIDPDTGMITEREGDFFMDGENPVGAWARVYRKNQKIPTYRRIRIDRYDTKKSQWEKNREGMACKCAEADALRSAFPSSLGGSYLQEEIKEISIKPPASNLFVNTDADDDDAEFAPSKERKLPISKGKNDNQPLEDEPATIEGELLK